MQPMEQQKLLLETAIAGCQWAAMCCPIEAAAAASHDHEQLSKAALQWAMKPTRASKP